MKIRIDIVFKKSRLTRLRLLSIDIFSTAELADIRK